MSEDTGKWVLIAYYDNAPSSVYGLFDSEEAARAYGEKYSMAFDGYDIRSVLDADYWEDC
jgi:uncharacterized protein YbjT (DUF2867 family)